MKKLKLEFNSTEFSQEQIGDLGQILMTPDIDEDYWLFRVKVSKNQSIVGFPKFNTIGIGFAKETNWNTNLPFSCNTNEIYNHIKCNKACKASYNTCIKAIEMIQTAAKELYLNNNGERKLNIKKV